MDEFTNEEKQRIDYLYGNDFKDITPNDALLIARFEVCKAKQDEEHKAIIAAIQAETEMKLANAKIEHERAMNNLETLKDEALKRLEVLADEQA